MSDYVLESTSERPPDLSIAVEVGASTGSQSAPGQSWNAIAADISGELYAGRYLTLGFTARPRWLSLETGRTVFAPAFEGYVGLTFNRDGAFSHGPMFGIGGATVGEQFSKNSYTFAGPVFEVRYQGCLNLTRNFGIALQTAAFILREPFVYDGLDHVGPAVLFQRERALRPSSLEAVG